MHSLETEAVFNLWKFMPESKKISSFAKALVKLERFRVLEKKWKEYPETRPNLKEYVNIAKEFLPAAQYIETFYFKTIEVDRTRTMSRKVMALATSFMRRSISKGIHVTYRWGDNSLYFYKQYANKICGDVALLVAYIQFAY